ncbi:monooxygenase [Paracoccus siganidrum]|uniref:Bifunctional 3-(3-hydroxy-phenyl)propionate/3-hydroxycinnamic acid hydroxylase n=2 Tax=Paracoccus siganidrum TaxID=1276757 RepID=A0A418ZZE5_9RHOB|nr:bifunctional 3-(3-hydroxy-phenyl)propionate/3-hydroxycinnamic acid hydroxylase [Paracoccus siganidrum]RMC30019.1 monooxygenase [Paracoccus siganidrum]
MGEETMKPRVSQTDFDVIQIGYGPVSKFSALLLDRLGWRVGVFERFGEIFPLPRAVCIDHEIFRVMHAGGLGPIADRVTEPAPVYRWFNAEWQELISIDWTAGSVSGGTEVNFVHQPSLERELDAEAKRRTNIALHFEQECMAITQHDDHVVVRIRDTATGAERDHTARYVIGIDGANSFVRETLGITRSDLGFEADWLVVDFVLNDGLTARDLGLIECGQYCNPERPTTIVPGGIENGQICRRWEFMRLPHETREEMVETAKVQELLGDWIKPEQGRLVRHALYTFRSLVADRWRDGRILLAGDAAHVMPPFMGQGMCAGLRDVWNLGWKLDSVLSGAADPALLDTYQAERLPHVTDIIKASMFLGSIICIPDKDAAAERDRMFLSGEAPPPPPFPILTDGFLARDAQGAVLAPAGELSPHGTVRLNRRTGRFDTLVAPGLVLILTRELTLADLDPASRRTLERLGATVVTVAGRTCATDGEVADTQGQILPFMRERGLNAMLVRPDLYLFGGAADAAGLDRVLAELDRQARQVGLLATDDVPEPHMAASA